MLAIERRAVRKVHDSLEQGGGEFEARRLSGEVEVESRGRIKTNGSLTDINSEAQLHKRSGGS